VFWSGVFGGADVIDAGGIEFPGEPALAAGYDLHLKNQGAVLPENPETVGHVLRCGDELNVLVGFGFDSLRGELEAPPGHPIHTFMEEHKVILRNLSELKTIMEGLKDKGSLVDLGGDLERLKDISHHLVEAESHHQREEEVLFPALEKHDVVEPPQIMKAEHVDLRQKKKELYEASHGTERYPFNEFKARVIDSGEFLARELEGHIFKEDNILYQIALQVLSDGEWAEIKKACDRIGYCCFTPGQEHHEEGPKVVTLDMRSLPPFERHDKIFEHWDALKPGEMLRIINDHDPKPLHYQFEAEYKDLYQWEYEQEGPKDWIVKIRKTG